MRARLTRLLLAASVVVTALFGASCRKSAAERQATEEAEQKASQTTVTSGEIGDDKNEDQEARDRGLREQAEAIVDTRNEQLEYRGKLQHTLDELDGKRREAKMRGGAYVKAVDARRDVLKQDLDALDRVNDTEWPALKVKIDRDLKDQSSEREREGR